MGLQTAAVRVRQHALAFVARRQGFVAIVIKLSIVFVLGFALTQVFVLLRDYFDANPQVLKTLIRVVLRAGAWGFGIALGLYFLGWIGRHLGVPKPVLRKLDVTGNVILGTLAGTLILTLVVAFIVVAYSFMIVCLHVVANGGAVLWEWMLAAAAG